MQALVTPREITYGLQTMWPADARTRARPTRPLPSISATAAPSPTTHANIGMEDVLRATCDPAPRHAVALQRLPSLDDIFGTPRTAFEHRTQSLSPVSNEPEPVFPFASPLLLPTQVAGSHLPDDDDSSVRSSRSGSLSLSLDHDDAKPKRTSSAKLCGMPHCSKRAKAGGYCIAHGGGLRCSESGCQKHAVSLGLCISHGGGKRCSVEGCLNASRKHGVCWSHGGKRLCKVAGCTKGPKSGGYCWAHGGKLRK